MIPRKKKLEHSQGTGALKVAFGMTTSISLSDISVKTDPALGTPKMLNPLCGDGAKMLFAHTGLCATY